MALKTTSIAYTSEAPWRAGGIGVAVKKGASVAQMMRAAKVDWSVEKRPLGYFDDGDDGDFHRFNNHFAMVRSSDGKVLDICGNKYLPTQNKDFFDFGDELVRKGDAHWDTVGELAGGKIVYGLAKIDGDFSLPGKDKLTGYLFLGVPHIHGKSLVARVVTARDVCNNTMSVALRVRSSDGGDIFRMNHRNEFNAVQKERAHAILGTAKQQIEDFTAAANKLHKSKISISDAQRLIARVFQPDWSGKEEDLSPRMLAILEAYNAAPGAQPGTAWGAFNAVTYWTDHVASRSHDKRLTNAWLGRTSRQKSDMMHTLLAA